jgi:hypothetical protein
MPRQEISTKFGFIGLVKFRNCSGPRARGIASSLITPTDGRQLPKGFASELLVLPTQSRPTRLNGGGGVSLPVSIF